MAQIKKTINNKYQAPVKEKITLDENERCYIIDDVKLRRVTDWIQQFTHPFDAMGAAIGHRMKANKSGEDSLLPNIQAHYWHLNAGRAADIGSATHKFAEMYDIQPTGIPKTKFEEAVVKFIEDTKYIHTVIGNELRVTNKLYKLGGTIDRLVRNNSTGKYIIQDWKTYAELDNDHGKKMKKPFTKYPESNRIKTELQLLVYKYLGNIELSTGNRITVLPEQIEKCQIILLLENGNYSLEEVNIVNEEELKMILELSKEE